MRNKTGKPFATKEQNKDGYWVIYFNPTPKLDGMWYYSMLESSIDVTDAETLVKLLNDNEKDFY